MKNVTDGDFHPLLVDDVEITAAELTAAGVVIEDIEITDSNEEVWEFRPQKDMTAFELAEILRTIIIPLLGRGNFNVTVRIRDDLKRHFKRIDDA